MTPPCFAKPTNLICLILGLAFVSIVSHADYLRVQRPATVLAQPLKTAAVVSEARTNSILDLLDGGKQQGGYYKVTIPGQSSESGWIYRTFVRRFPGTIPPQPEVAATNPLGDPSYSPTELDLKRASRHLKIGKPQAVHERVREGYVLAHDARLKIPLWVQYELRREEVGGPADRKDNFKPDPTIPFGSRAELTDYRGSGLDRGHMAAAEDMSRSDKTMTESFLLSNMAPQVGVGFNQGLWKDLEAAARGWAQQRGAVTIITGPVFAETNRFVGYKVIGTNHVAMPTHCYKIVVDARDRQNVQALAFLVPNQDVSGRSLQEFLTSVDEVERLTGLDFLSALPKQVQEVVEAKKPIQAW